MPVVMAPRMPGKSRLNTVLSSRGLSIAESTVPFPRATNFDSENSMHTTLDLMHWFRNETLDINQHILTISSGITNLGINNVDYILNNLQDFILVSHNFDMYDKELKYSKALTALISLNLYKQYCGEDYNLPKVLSKRMLRIKEDLESYLKSRITRVRVGVADIKTCSL